jgi:hypothetical protein
MKSKESSEQIKIFEWIKQNEEAYPVLKTIFHTPNSFFGTNFGIVMWLKKLGMRKGVYDIIVPIAKNGYSSLWIEMKKEKGKLTSEQKMFSELINTYSDSPTKFEVFYDADSCILSIKEYLQI